MRIMVTGTILLQINKVKAVDCAIPQLKQCPCGLKEGWTIPAKGHAKKVFIIKHSWGWKGCLARRVSDTTMQGWYQEWDSESLIEASDAEFWASSNSFIWRSACSLSQALIPIIMSSIVPVVPKNTRGASDFLFIPTGIASKAPATENTQVPNALQT